MSSKRDSSGDGVTSLKRSASAAAVPLCKTQDCLAFNKKLGNGYCKDCCLERNVPFKSSKKKTVEKIDDTATPAATTTLEPAEFSIILDPSKSAACTLPQPSVAIGDGQRFHAIGTKVLICAETNCAIATVVSIHIAKTAEIAERLKDSFKYIVQDANNGVKSMVGSICANTYVDVADWPAWPAGAHPRGTLVHGLSRSITPSGTFESRLECKRIQPFGNIAGVSFNFDGNPVHYIVQYVPNDSQVPETRVILASDVVL
jgi:hypothetical protein